MADPIPMTRYGRNLARVAVEAIQGDDFVSVGFFGSGETYELPADFAINANSPASERELVEFRLLASNGGDLSNYWVEYDVPTSAWEIHNGGAEATPDFVLWVQYHHTVYR